MSRRYTPRQASRILGCSDTHIRNMILRGEITCSVVPSQVNSGQQYMISQREVDRLLDQHGGIYAGKYRRT